MKETTSTIKAILLKGFLLFILMTMSFSAIAQYFDPKQDLYISSDEKNFGYDFLWSDVHQATIVGSPLDRDTGSVTVSSTEPFKFQKLKGVQENSLFGSSISISDNGNYLAVAAHLEDTKKIDAGVVRIYKYEKDSYELVQTIFGLQEFEYFGIKLSIEDNGRKLFIGSGNYIEENKNLGRLSIYELNAQGKYILDHSINGNQNENIGLNFQVNQKGDQFIIKTDYTSDSLNETLISVYFKKNSKWTLKRSLFICEPDNSPLNRFAVSNNGAILAMVYEQINSENPKKIFHIYEIQSDRSFRLINKMERNDLDPSSLFVLNHEGNLIAIANPSEKERNYSSISILKITNNSLDLIEQVKQDSKAEFPIWDMAFVHESNAFMYSALEGSDANFALVRLLKPL